MRLEDSAASTGPTPRLASTFLYTFGRFIAGLVYRVNAHGQEHIPKEGGALLLPNHVTWVDALVLQLACPRPVRYLVFEGIYQIWWLNPIFRAVGAIPISPGRAKSAIEGASSSIKRGELVCVFPEGELTRTGMLLKLKRGFELIAREAGGPVIPVWLDDLWGSIFSFEKKRYFTKWPRRIPYRATVAFGAPIPPEEATTAFVREQLLTLGSFCYEKRLLLNQSLAVSCLRGLKRRFDAVAVIDGMDHSRLTRGKLLAAAIALAEHLKKEVPERRVGIVLPPSKGGLVANLAVLLANKVPVNLNFTAGHQAIEASIRKGELKTILTAGAMKAKVGDFPWTENVIQLERILPRLKGAIVRWFLLARILPSFLLCRMIGLPLEGGAREAVLLFTSGSSGEPKGVVLSHRNLIANVAQFGQMLDLHHSDQILASLPLFHSFGCTVTLWYPMIEGLGIVTYPSPLEVSKNAELIEKYRVSLMLATPGFLRGYLRRATREQLESLKLIVTGAEKLPMELREAFQAKFGKEIYEGYGLTETSPVASVNLPDPIKSRATDSVQEANRPGSVGRLVPGMTARITHADTEEPLTLHDIGMLWMRGPNIFEGYLGEPQRTADVLHDGWFKSGDLARFDEDGFLFIEGRLSRFSKIAGEMVPHETVEENILKALGASEEEERTLAIMSIPDEAKGEALVLLSTREIDLNELRSRLAAQGLPNLWLPRILHRVEKIPVLGSGKLDIGGCKELVKPLIK